MLLLLSTGLLLKNFLLHQVKIRIEASLHYAKLRLSVIPPAIILEDVRTVSVSPFFSARKVVIQVPYLFLLNRNKPLRVFIDQPVLRVYEGSRPAKKAKFKLGFPLAFSIENGVIRNGEFYFWGKKIGYAAKGIKAFFRQKKDAFMIRAECEDNSLLLESLNFPLTGTGRIILDGKENDLRLRQMVLRGPDFKIKAEGMLSNADDPRFEFQAELRAPASLITDIFDLPFRWEGTMEGRGRLTGTSGRAFFNTDFFCESLILNSVSLGEVDGRVAVGGEGRGHVELAMRKKPYPAEFMDIAFGGGKVEGTARGVHLDPILSYVRVPWPVRSAVWGNFSLAKKILSVRAEFKEDLLVPTLDKFPFRGPVDFSWDGKKEITFSSRKLESSFGVLDVEGALGIGRDVRVAIRGDVSDVRQGREFASLILRSNLKFPEIRGQGRSEIKILGDYRAPQVKIDFFATPGGFAKFDAAAVGGLVEITRGEVTGVFKVDDPEMKGEIRLLSKSGWTDVQIYAAEGSLEKILPGLDLRLPLRGRAAGDFEIAAGGLGLRVKGDFSSPALDLARQSFKNIKGRLEWTVGNQRLSFPALEADFYGGHVKGSAVVGLKSREFDVNLEAAKMSLSSLFPKVEGLLSFDLRGKGSLGRDSATGKFRLMNLRAAGIGPAEAAGDLELNYLDGKLNIKLAGELDPGRNIFSMTFSYPQPDDSYLVNLKGSLNNLDLVLPWKGARGEANFLAEIKGNGPSPQLSGVVDFKGSLFPFPKFPHAVTDYSGLVFIQNNKASIRSVQAKLGGGDVFGSGEIRFGKAGVEYIDLRADGRGMVLALLERTRVLSDGSLRLLKDESRFVLSGDFLIKELSWRRELSEKFIFSSNSYYQEKKEPGFFDDLKLDIRLRADDNVVIENTLGKIQGRFDLAVGGNVNSPIILGDIEGLRGDVYFQDRRFRLLKARLSFFNPIAIDPYLDFQGETYLKDYRVTFSLSGLMDHLRPEFVSSPPLPPEDVLALLALGESFKRTYSYDTSSQLGTGSLLSFPLAEEAKKRAEKLFSLDRFRIDPFVLGASTEMTARLTVGKKISRNIILLYSTNLTSQREEIVRLEWEFGDNFSLVGMRDERGRVSFDAKIWKRF